MFCSVILLLYAIRCMSCRSLRIRCDRDDSVEVGIAVLYVSDGLLIGAVYNDAVEIERSSIVVTAGRLLR